MTPTVDHMPTVYTPADRPQGHVLREGTWFPCEVRMSHDDGRLNICWDATDGKRVDNVPAEAVRIDE